MYQEWVEPVAARFMTMAKPRNPNLIKKISMGAAIGGAVTGMGDRSKVKSKVRWPKMSPKSERGGKVAGGLVSTSTDQACTAWAV